MQTVLSWLENAAAEQPEKIALVDENNSCTYAEWLKQARAMAAVLPAELNREPIGVMCDRSYHPLIAFMAVAFSGNFYVPLEASTPAARLAVIAQNSGMRILLGYAVEAPCTLPEGVQYLSLQALPTATPAQLAHVMDVRKSIQGDDPLYMVYTSGSTGVPKGVIKSHRSVKGFVQAYCKVFDFRQEDVWGNQSPFYFDAFAKDLYTVLATTASMHILSKKLFSFPIELVKYLNEANITVISWVPSALAIMAQLRVFDVDVPRSLRYVLFVGEVFAPKYFNIWRRALPKTVFANTYGFSEVAGVCLYAQLDEEQPETQPLPLGRPFPGTQVMVLDENRCPVQPGETGELCVRSDSLALGYYNDPERTAKVFIQNPLVYAWPERVYRSGDLVYCGDDGNLRFVGRADLQIKHMGHRIELQEIEAAALRCEELSSVCCVYDEKRSRIVLAYVSRSGADIGRAELNAVMSKHLPDYMLPHRLVRLEQMPLNANGKIDRPALRGQLIR